MHCSIEGAEEGKGYDEVRAIREKRGEMEEEVEGRWMRWRRWRRRGAAKAHKARLRRLTNNVCHSSTLSIPSTNETSQRNMGLP